MRPGDTYERLTAVGPTGRRAPDRHAIWMFLCSCGATTEVVPSRVASGNTRSCGCLARQRTRLPWPAERQVWRSMHKRCRTDPNYAGRGIVVCARWSDFDSFLVDMGPRPTSGHEIDRINNDGNYEPGNCRWATRPEQGRNRRTNRMITFADTSMCLLDACRAAGVSMFTVYHRVRTRQVSHQEAFDGLVRARGVCSREGA